MSQVGKKHEIFTQQFRGVIGPLVKAGNSKVARTSVMRIAIHPCRKPWDVLSLQLTLVCLNAVGYILLKMTKWTDCDKYFVVSWIHWFEVSMHSTQYIVFFQLLYRFSWWVAKAWSLHTFWNAHENMSKWIQVGNNAAMHKIIAAGNHAYIHDHIFAGYGANLLLGLATAAAEVRKMLGFLLPVSFNQCVL